MAYMSQENKKAKMAELKKVIPAGWKWSLAVNHHSTLQLTISAAPVDLIGAANGWQKRNEKRPEYYGLNEYHLDYDFSGELLATFKSIKAAMNVGNHDNSDAMTDYFDVGWYIDISFGRFGRPFKFVPPTPAQEELKKYWAGSISGQLIHKEIADIKAKLAAMEAERAKPVPPTPMTQAELLTALQNTPTEYDIPKPTRWYNSDAGNC